MATSRRRRISAFLLFVFLFGCTSWHPEPVTPRAFFTDKEPLRVRVTLADGRRVELDSARLRGDSVVGTSSREPVQIALTDIREVATSRSSTSRSVALGIGIGAGVLVIVSAIALASWDGPYSGCSGSPEQ